MDVCLGTQMSSAWPDYLTDDGNDCYDVTQSCPYAYCTQVVYPSLQYCYGVNPDVQSYTGLVPDSPWVKFSFTCGDPSAASYTDDIYCPSKHLIYFDKDACCTSPNMIWCCPKEYSCTCVSQTADCYDTAYFDRPHSSNTPVITTEDPIYLSTSEVEPTLFSTSRYTASATSFGVATTTSRSRTQTSALATSSPALTGTPAILSLLATAIPDSLRTDPEAACFLATTSNTVYTTPPWYSSLPGPAQSFYASSHTDFAACTSIENTTTPSGGTALSGGEKAGVAVGSIAGAAGLAGLVALILFKRGKIGKRSPPGTDTLPENSRAATASPYSGSIPPPQSAWNGAGGMAWYGAAAGSNAPSPAPVSTGSPEPYAGGAMGHRHSGYEQSHGHEPYGGEGQLMYPGSEGGASSTSHGYPVARYPGAQSYQAYAPGSTLSSNSGQVQHQYYGTDRSMSPVEVGGGGGNSHEAPGDQSFDQAELVHNPRYR